MARHLIKVPTRHLMPLPRIYGVRFKPKYFVFDRGIIKRNWRQINEGPLKKAGLLIRKIARNSIRRRRYGSASPAGTPPYSHAPGKSPPFKQIYSVPNYMGAEVVIGMVGYGSRGQVSPPVPGIQEHGLRARRWLDTQFGKRKKRNRNQPKLTAAQGKAIRRKMIQKGIIVRRSVKYKPRPFMDPALRKAQPRLPAMWRGSVGGRII